MPEILPTIFLLGREDVDEVAALEKTAFPLAWTPDIFARILRGNRVPLPAVHEADLSDLAVFGLCFCHNTPALLGYMSIRILLLAKEAEIYNVAVVPELRGQGHGTRLVSAVLAKLADCSIEDFFLEARETNQAALSLYRGCGFEQYGLRKNYYADGENAVLMRARAH